MQAARTGFDYANATGYNCSMAAKETITIRLEPDVMRRLEFTGQTMGTTTGEAVRTCVLLGLTQLDGAAATIAKPAAQAFIRILASCTEEQLGLFRDLLTDPTPLVGDPGEA